jgi:hypothetical protein
MSTKLRKVGIGALCVGISVLIPAAVNAGVIQGRVFDLNAQLLDKETIIITAINSTGTIIANTKSDAKGAFALKVPDNRVATLENKDVSVEFRRAGFVTRRVEGLLGTSERAQIVDVTVPLPVPIYPLPYYRLPCYGPHVYYFYRR